ncbi:MAG TPA: hypothetical protein VNT51_06630 [Miltoncostaeaceae bacterium]|nr:hypothetical protein [Miltoncostaeaceae bacterium]
MYELPTPALPTAEPASSSLLPTPAVNDMGAAYTPEQWDAWTARMQEKHGNGNGHGRSLEIEAQRLLPTPTADNSRGLPQPGTDYASLPNAVLSLLPTPTAMDAHGSRGYQPDGTPYTATAGVTLTDAALSSSGAHTAPRLRDGKPSSDDPLPGQLSLDDAGSD